MFHQKCLEKFLKKHGYARCAAAGQQELINSVVLISVVHLALSSFSHARMLCIRSGIDLSIGRMSLQCGGKQSCCIVSFTAVVTVKLDFLAQWAEAKVQE
jgi:hypothetical protein